MNAWRSPLCIALDTREVARACELTRAVSGSAGLVKIGMELFYAHGRQAYALVAQEGLPVFLDLKLHDIPNTVASALTSLMRIEPRPAIVDVHATGGPAMLEAAVKAVDGRAKVVAVTVLTSLSDLDLVSGGFDPRRRELAVDLARLAQSHGCDGVVCSPRDVAAVRAACGSGFITVVPGIRPEGAAMADQVRVASPAEALAAGADILVVGRPVTGARDPGEAARSILAALPAAA